METNTISSNPVPRTPASEPAAASTDAGASALSSDFETFLKMLTVQMENQDPLNPIQSSDFAVQLATFSGVEQQVRTNDLLESMVSGQSLNELSDIAGWVGQEARAPVAATFSGAPVELYLDLPAAADQATVTVRDADGSAVTQIAISADASTYTWDGTDAGGVPVAPGQYSFTVETRAQGEFLETIVPDVYARVSEVRLENGKPVLVTEGGEVVSAGDITGIRQPDAR